jgi:hypothetical protein
MDFRRSRRFVRMPAGLPTNFSEPRVSAAAVWPGARMTFGRQRFRGPSKSPGTEPVDSRSVSGPPERGRKRQRSLVSLLIGAVLALWLLLLLAGHY